MSFTQTENNQCQKLWVMSSGRSEVPYQLGILWAYFFHQDYSINTVGNILSHMNFADELDLSLAWRKTKRDYSHHMNSFVSSPYIIEILDHNEEEWLKDLRESLDNGSYTPRASRIVDVPKKNYHLRPASVLHPEDLVVYSALMLLVYDELRSSIVWSAGERRFSHILREDPSSSNQWDEFERQHWTDMQDRKIDLAEDSEYVLQTDVSGFYENIDIERVTSIFKQLTGRQDVGNEVRHLIRPWADPRKRGLPQGYGPSDILAEIYLDSVDQRLRNNGYDHVRYNDDFTVFCDSRNEAIEAQNLLEREFRSRGLNMKSGKTNIISSLDALQEYAQPEAKFKEIKEQIESDIQQDHPSGYSPPEKAAKVARRAGKQSPYGADTGGESREESRDSSKPIDEVDDDGELKKHLRRVYREYIDDVDFDDLDQHIFRYLIRKLGESKDPIAVDYCIKYILDGHADVRRILNRYFSSLQDNEKIIERLADAITNNELRYEYHEFLIIRWFYQEGYSSNEVVHCARQVVNRDDGLVETREYATAILSEHGDYSDWERTQVLYGESERELTKAVMAFAVRRFEKGRRSSFYDHIQGTHSLVDKAIQLGKQRVD